MDRIELNRDELHGLIEKAINEGKSKIADRMKEDEAVYEKIVARDLAEVKVIYYENGEVRVRNKPDGLERIYSVDRGNTYKFAKNSRSRQ